MVIGYNKVPDLVGVMNISQPTIPQFNDEPIDPALNKLFADTMSSPASTYATARQSMPSSVVSSDRTRFSFQALSSADCYKNLHSAVPEFPHQQVHTQVFHTFSAMQHLPDNRLLQNLLPKQKQQSHCLQIRMLCQHYSFHSRQVRPLRRMRLLHNRPGTCKKNRHLFHLLSFPSVYTAMPAVFHH